MIVDENFKGLPRPLLWPIFLTRKLTRDLFAVANLLVKLSGSCISLEWVNLCTLILYIN